MQIPRWVAGAFIVLIVMAGTLMLRSSFSPEVLRIAFLDVGQGDAIFIESPAGAQMIIDGGIDKSVLRELSALMSPFDRTLDVVLATHPDADHLGGLVHVLSRYSVAHVFHSGIEADTPAYRAYSETLTQSGAKVHLTTRGTIIDLGRGAYVRVIFPDRVLTSVSEPNAASAVVELVYGNVELLFTGDAPKAVEEYVVALEGEGLQSDVLKVGHHGSRTSTSDRFVASVAPAVAVISAGEDNSYGHPHAEVTATLHSYNVKTVGTYEEGTIVFETDGTTLWRID